VLFAFYIFVRENALPRKTLEGSENGKSFSKLPARISFVVCGERWKIKG
jgi:hypothetical protein